MKDRFYLACFRDNVGSNVAFHGNNGCGYPTDLDKADVYSLSDAQRAWDNGREFDQPISADHVDELAVWRVDMQYIPNETIVNDAVDWWVAFERGRYDGNDVFWLTDKLPSTDYSKAKRFHQNEVEKTDHDVIYVPRYITEREKRRTFAYADFNKRKMVQAAGLRVPDKIKRYRRRKPNPKTRVNCTECGRFQWQLNPYDFEGCRNFECKGYKTNYASGTFDG